MEKEELIKKVNDFFIEEFEAEEEDILPGNDLMEALDLDSLDLVDLVVVIDKTFGVKVKSEEFVGIKTIQDFYDYIDGKVNVA